ncbi:hypothetical protein H6G97_28880 [Nostoc flagelliforme FACHB-838]|uniref:Uncharacterized protein n=1 Tax=Nostoc flagelliforme FACHB-838 TaxID=2692904 RepID=A0ABR8DVX2_9NOSO|nr:hypothetical protein [Nostoc flagelliforme]MBD2533359.1 hypothetical protein [Nostoc flagelliforme FACHB-838]
MIDTLILLFLLFLAIPFAIAQIMPNKKWLIAYTIFFGTLAIVLYYEHITTPINRRGDGFSYIFGKVAACLFYTSIIVGIINRATVLYLRSINVTINIWLIVSLVLLNVILIVLMFIGLMIVY